MLKNFNPIPQDNITVFCEDVYLFTDSGKVLTGRHGGSPIKNIFDLIDSQEYDFVRQNMFFAGLHPLLIVDSTKGLIFIDDSLFGSYRLLIAIIPHFSRNETLGIFQSKLRSIAMASPKIKAELEDEYILALNKDYDEFADRLLETHRGAYYYRVHGRTNGEISMMMSEIAYDYSKFCGCELELTISGVGLYEMKNDLCIDSYIFSLVHLLFLARNYSNYSKRRRAKMDVFFNEMGIYLEFGFEIASEYASEALLSQSEALKEYKFRAYTRLLDCDFYQSEDIFAVRVYPWFKHPNSADLKEEMNEFIYNI